MRKLSALGMALMIGGGLVAGAAPARAQELNCSIIEPDPVCPLVNRQIAHVNEELGYALEMVYPWYDYTDRTVRCIVFQECY